MSRDLCLVVAVTLVFTTALQSQSPAPERLDVRAYDTSGAAPEQLYTAETLLVAMFRAAGIEVHWTQCRGPRGPSTLASCNDVLHSRELVMRIALTPVAERNPDVLGFAYIDPRAKRGTLGTVYMDRVQTLARSRGLHPAPILARVMSHEVAHLLLGMNNHASTGVMQRSLRSRDHGTDWTFSPDEAAEMRGALAARPRRHVELAAAAGRSDAPVGAR